MTYLLFLVVFIVPAILVAGFLPLRALPELPGPRQVRYIAAICLIALVYTTPWDNYLVYRGIWWYGTEGVLGTLGYVPYEEYLFFVLQPILTGLLYFRLLGRFPRRTAYRPTVRLWGALVFGGLTVLGAVFFVLGQPRTLYLGLILAWSAPVLAILWGYAGAVAWQVDRAFWITLALSTGYLWFADRMAIGMGIWTIADAYSVGWNPLGLPIEEALFFLVTNLLVLLGLTLFTYGHEPATRPADPG